MQAGSTVTDQFFTAIYSWDWTVFNDGIEKPLRMQKNMQIPIGMYKDAGNYKHQI